MDTVVSVLVLGFVLSLDNFRLAIALGAFKLSWRRALRTALVFGLWDTVSPLVGVLIGRYFGLQLGGVAARFIPIRSDLLSSMGLSIMALVLALGY